MKRATYGLTQHGKWSSQKRCWEKQARQRKGPSRWAHLYEVQKQTKLVYDYFWRVEYQLGEGKREPSGSWRWSTLWWGETHAKIDQAECLNMCTFSLKTSGRASLVVQWLRICLPMQGTRVRALVWEDPTFRGATRPVSHNYWACASGACASQQERPR